MTSQQSLAVDIRPDSDIYGTYRRLSYRPWYAIAEFVDNATQNFYAHRDEIERITGQHSVLHISIYYDRESGTFTVVDDAMGMSLNEFSRALQLAKPPGDTSGRSEFGMGLKTAACWLGPRWRVTSKRLGDNVEYSAKIDVDKLKMDKPTSLAIASLTDRSPSEHYTRVEVEGLLEYERNFKGRTLGKIKTEIASIYRRDLLSGDVVIEFNGEILTWAAPDLLVETANATAFTWKQHVDLIVGGKQVGGWIGLLARGKAADAGLHLFRRDRIIQGGPTNGWKPMEIFGAPNSFQAQRLVGELDFDTWPVSHTKDAIDWSGDDEDDLIKALKDATTEYVAKAKESRRTDSPATLSRAAIESIVEETREELEENEDLGIEITFVEDGDVPPTDEHEDETTSHLLEELGSDVHEFRFGNTQLPTMTTGFLGEAHSSEPLVRTGFPTDNQVTLAVNLQHPFVVQLVGTDAAAMKLLTYLLYVDALVERHSRRNPELTPSQLRGIKDRFLRTLKPMD